MAFFVDRSGSETTIKTTAKNENSGLLIGSKKRSTNAERKMQRAKAIAKRRLSRKDVPDSSNSFDLWSTTIEEDLKEKTFVDSKSEFTIVLEQKKRRRNDYSLKTEIEVRGGSRGIPVALPGQSYNPDKESHDAALSQAFAIAESRQMHDELWSELLSEASKHRSDGNELSDAGSDIEADSVEKNTAELVRKPAKAEDRLTKAQRNKRQRVRELEKTIQENKEEKAKIKQINKVKAIASDVLKEFKEKEDRRLELAEKRSNRTVDEIAQLTRVGNEKFELPIPDVPFTDELKGSVRLIQPQSSLIKEEFINLQRTGVIEPRKPKGQKRRYPQKYYNRWTVQD